MSRWSDDFDNHAIHNSLKQCSEWLRAEFDETSVELEEERRRLSKVFDSISKILSELDPDFAPIQIMDQIH